MQTHEAAVDALYGKGQPLADEAKSISRELKIELGLVDRESVPQQAAEQAG